MGTNIITYTSSGSFTVPAGITLLRVFGVGAGGSGGGGGGGAGGGGTSVSGVGGGAGGGAIAREELIRVAPRSTLTITVASSPNGGAGSVTNTDNGSDGTDGGDTSVAYSYLSVTRTLIFSGAEGGKKGYYGGDGTYGNSFARGGDSTKHSANSIPGTLAASSFTGTTSFLYLPRPGQGGWGLSQDLLSNNYTAWLYGGHHGAGNYGLAGTNANLTDGGVGGGGGASNWYRYHAFQSVGGNGGNGGVNGNANGTAGTAGTYGSGGGGGGGGYGSPSGSGHGLGGAGGAGGPGLVIISWEI